MEEDQSKNQGVSNCYTLTRDVEASVQCQWDNEEVQWDVWNECALKFKDPLVEHFKGPIVDRAGCQEAAVAADRPCCESASVREPWDQMCLSFFGI